MPDATDRQIVHFTVTPGVVALMGSAGSIPARKPVFSMQGDLCQMAAQKEFLLSHGFQIGQSDVYPVLFDENDVPRALEMLWVHRIPGWWHYESNFKAFGICEKSEFQAALDAEIAEKRRE